jgi:putative hemolysin
VHRNRAEIPIHRQAAAMTLVNVFIILLLILLNGFFAMSELAVVSARRGRLQALAEDGRAGAGTALRLAEDPGRFLSAVQIGISLVGVLAGAFGGATLADPLGEWLAGWPGTGRFSEEIAFALVVGAITYVTLIAGELVPKRLALGHAEAIACLVAPVMALVARVGAPLVAVLDASTRLVLRLTGHGSEPTTTVSDEEIRLLLSEATRAGVVAVAEQEMISGVMRLADRPVSGIMTPRPDIAWIDSNDPPEQQFEQLRASSYSRLLVCDGVIDEVIGIVQAKDLLDRALAGEPVDLAAAMREPPAVPESMGALEVLDLLKRSPVHMALVVDEYGSLLGLITTTDVLKVIMGGFMEHGHQPGSHAVQRPDGSWLLDGGMPLDELRERFELRRLVADEGYHTLAGWLLGELDRLPTEGDRISYEGWCFEVVDMDGYRVDKVLAMPPAEADAQDESGSDSDEL